MSDGSTFSLGYEKGRADAIRELTEWRTGEPPEEFDAVITKHVDYPCDFWVLRRKDEMWPFAVKRGLFDGSWQWLPIPQ